MKKKSYEKPTMEVVKLQHQAFLYQTSGDVNASMPTPWEEETVEP